MTQIPRTASELQENAQLHWAEVHGSTNDVLLFVEHYLATDGVRGFLEEKVAEAIFNTVSRPVQEAVAAGKPKLDVKVRLDELVRRLARANPWVQKNLGMLGVYFAVIDVARGLGYHTDGFLVLVSLDLAGIDEALPTVEEDEDFRMPEPEGLPEGLSEGGELGETA